MAGRPRTRSHEEWLEYQRQKSAEYYAKNKHEILAKQRQKRAQARKDKTEKKKKNERILILEAELEKLKSKLEDKENE